MGIHLDHPGGALQALGRLGPRRAGVVVGGPAAKAVPGPRREAQGGRASAAPGGRACPAPRPPHRAHATDTRVAHVTLLTPHTPCLAPLRPLATLGVPAGLEARPLAERPPRCAALGRDRANVLTPQPRSPCGHPVSGSGVRHGDRTPVCLACRVTPEKRRPPDAVRRPRRSEGAGLCFQRTQADPFACVDALRRAPPLRGKKSDSFPPPRPACGGRNHAGGSTSLLSGKPLGHAGCQHRVRLFSETGVSGPTPW